MAYLGKGLNDIATANIVVDTMTGNGSDTTLALSWGAGSKGIGSVNDVSVFYGGCQQRPGQDFTLANGTVTFTTAPMNGVNVVAVVASVDVLMSAACLTISPKGTTVCVGYPFTIVLNWKVIGKELDLDEKNKSTLVMNNPSSWSI